VNDGLIADAGEHLDGRVAERTRAGSRGRTLARTDLACSAYLSMPARILASSSRKAPSTPAHAGDGRLALVTAAAATVPVAARRNVRRLTLGQAQGGADASRAHPG
jgi:hypothetical protein